MPAEAEKRYDQADALVLAQTIFGEARGEPAEGREAVGHVVVNRINASGFPDTVPEVCRQPHQFSCWNKSDPSFAKIEALQAGANKVFDECRAAAERVLDGAANDNTGGATHYHSKMIPPPQWAKDATLTAEIGSLKFYRDVR